jgi:hypothetical protein
MHTELQLRNLKVRYLFGNVHLDEKPLLKYAINNYNLQYCDNSVTVQGVWTGNCIY